MSHESNRADAVPAQELITFQEYMTRQAQAEHSRSDAADAVCEPLSYPFFPMLNMKAMHTSMQYLSGVSEYSSACYFQMAKLAFQAFHPVQKPLP